MNFDIEDVKSWANRHEVKVGDVGFVACAPNELMWTKATIKEIIDDNAKCFLAQPLNETIIFQYSFFLPLDAVKEDKPKEKKYRPFKTMRELTEVVRGKDWEMNDITTGDELMIRNKWCEDRHRRVLITDLTLDNDCNLISLNDEYMKVWLNTYEVMSASAHDWVPFGVEVEEDEGFFLKLKEVEK